MVRVGVPANGVRAPAAGVFVTITGTSGTLIGGFGIAGIPPYGVGVFGIVGIGCVFTKGTGRGNGPAIDSTGTAPRAAAAPGTIGFGFDACDDIVLVGEADRSGIGTRGESTAGCVPVVRWIAGCGPLARCAGIAGCGPVARVGIACCGPVPGATG